MKAFIPIYPPKIFKDPRVAEALRDLQSPVSIHHTLIPCGQCGESGWIGPKQRAMADAGDGEVICVYCLMKHPDFRGEIPMISLNPDIDQAPRRNV